MGVPHLSVDVFKSNPSQSRAVELMQDLLAVVTGLPPKCQNRPCMTYSSSKAGTTSIMADRFKLNNFSSNVKGRGNILGTIFFMHSFKAYGGSATTDIGNCYEMFMPR